MFEPVSVPFGARMLFNTVRLKPGVNFDDVELALGEMCNVVKNTYGGDKGGFIAGQVFRFSGFVSDEGSLGAPGKTDDHVAIVTYWRSFEEHEKSHADAAFKAKFAALGELCTDSKELGYEMLWQGESDPSH
jgi:heme-degrading monooxygenase HmoA